MKSRAPVGPRPLTAIIVMCMFVRSASAQHSDVFISVVDNRIVVQAPFHADSIRSFDVLGDGTVWHGTNPGYSTTGPEQFKLNDQVGFNVVSPLLFSDGQSWNLADDDNYIRHFWPVFPELTVTASAATGNQPGFLIAAVGHRGTLHQHHTFELALFSGNVPPTGAFAVQQVIKADGYVTSDPFWIVLNNGLSVTDFGATLRSLPPIGVVGDFDRNGVLDIRDLNRLHDQILKSSEPSELTDEFDLTNDTRIGPEDLEYWVRDVRRSWIGDANLDGEFNSSDMVQVFQLGLYNEQVSANTSWGYGDWNADGLFDSGDLIAAFQDGGYGLGERVVIVPEPGIAMALRTLAIVACLWIRSDRIRLPPGPGA